jgi:hypothetical protein
MSTRRVTDNPPQYLASNGLAANMQNNQLMGLAAAGIGNNNSVAALGVTTSNYTAGQQFFDCL